MHFPPYILQVPDHPQVSKTLLFSLLNGKAIVVPSDFLEKMRSNFLHDTHHLPLDIIKLNFLRENFLVEDELDGKRKIAEAIYKTIHSRDKAALSVLTTTDCNMACPYCHEGLRKQKNYMSYEMAQRIAKFCVRDFISNETRELWIYFYGGEPLLNVGAIEMFLSSLQIELRIANLCPSIILEMSTNGILLTRSLACLLKKIGLSSVQITLDGPPEIHDKRRITGNGEGTFATILRNIQEILDILNITIRINIDRQNLHSAANVLTTLSQMDLLTHLRVYADFVTNTFENPAHCREFVIKDLEDKKGIVDVWRQFRLHGVKLFGLRFTEGMCGNLGSNSLVVDPEGKIYNCIGFVGQSDHAVSDIEHFKAARTNFSFRNCKPYLACLDCPYVPVCGGGCRVQAFIETGDITGRSCNRAFYDYAYPEFLRMRFPPKT